MDWIFLNLQDVMKIHMGLIDRFGGSHGLRDEGGLESVLAAAKNRFLYKNASLPICAATYAYHLTKAHAFIDGNKRIAAVVSELFLDINGARLTLSHEEAIHLFLALCPMTFPEQGLKSYLLPTRCFFQSNNERTK